MITKEIHVRGVMFDDGWDFDAPIVLYSGFLALSDGGSICRESIYHAVESSCLDWVMDGNIPNQWSDLQTKEIRWRGWSERGFRRRKNAVHAEFKVKLIHEDDGTRNFEILSMEGFYPERSAHEPG